MVGFTTNQGTLLRTKGCAVLRKFFGAEELRAIAPGLGLVLSSARQPCMSRRGNDLVPLRWNDAITQLILNSAQRIASVRSLLRAADLKWISGYVSTNHPISYRPDPTQIAVLCYLVDTTSKNGALRVLPGSHLKSMPLHRMLPEPHGEEANSLPADHPAMADSLEQETISVKAGDAVVIDYRLLHGTHANDTLDNRDCILLSFVPDWRGLPREIKAHLTSHPALPQQTEASMLSDCPFAELFPLSGGEPATLAVSRLPPTMFVMQ